MKYLILVVLFGLLGTLLVGSTEASFCPCNLRKAEVCGSNGVTYRNRCEFECSQRQYKKLGRILNIRKQGPCFQNKWN